MSETSFENVTGLIFDIQRYSLHDGPGLRTDVFFKGCPLRCAWCANPESQHIQPEFALSAQQCIGCGQFVETCPVRWANDRGKEWTPELQAEYARRMALCPTEAMHQPGERRTAGQVMQEVLRDRMFYGDGGGLTLTGGDPLMQPDLAEALLRLAKNAGISTAMETCGYSIWAVWERLLPFLDHILYDIKHINPEIHQRFTGVKNDLILDNLRQLTAHHAPVTIRVPLIPGFNAAAANVHAIARFVLHLHSSLNRIDLLPYHTLGKPKYSALNRDYPWDAHPRLGSEEIEIFADILRSYGFQVHVGG